MLYDINEVNKIKPMQIIPLSGDLAEDLIVFANRSAKYIVRKWWKYKGYQRLIKETYISIKIKSIKELSCIANNARLLSTIIAMNILDADIIGAKKQTIQDKCIKLICALSNTHYANDKEGWHNSYTATNTAISAWLMWDKLNSRDKLLIVNMLEKEATIALDYKATFRYNKDNKLINANSIISNLHVISLLNTALCMMPKNENYALWHTKLKDISKATRATKSSKQQGYNIDDSGSIADKNGIDIDTMKTIVISLDNVSISTLSNDTYDKSLANLALKVYDSFNSLYINHNGKQWRTLYDMTNNNNPIAKLSIPNKIRQSSTIMTEIYTQDVLAYSNGYTKAEVLPRQWAYVRMKKLNTLQVRNSSGAVYSDKKSNQLRESVSARSTAIAYLALFLKVSGNMK